MVQWGRTLNSNDGLVKPKLKHDLLPQDQQRDPLDRLVKTRAKNSFCSVAALLDSIDSLVKLLSKNDVLQCGPRLRQ